MRRLSALLDQQVKAPYRTAILLALAAVPLAAYAVLDLPLQHHLAVALVFMGVGVAIARHAPGLRLMVGLLSVALSARYVWWRGTETLIWRLSADGATSLALYGAEVFGFLLLLAGYFQTAFTRPRAPTPIRLDARLDGNLRREVQDGGRPLPSVDVFVPSYNEGTDVVRRTLTGAAAMDYPNKTVWLLDEKRRPEMKALCDELGVSYMTRPDNRGAKAGNINHALARTTGELVAVFDADQVPVRSFLRMTVGYFLDNPKMALVQTPHHFYNPDPFERNLYLEDTVPSEQVMFYHVIQVGNDFWNSSFFCGSCALLRRTALESVGGIAQETVTEDAHTALKMHALGWESAYLAVPQAAGLATERYGYYVTQRVRWARGMIQILRLDNPLLKRGLTLPQRVNYFNAACHFLFGLPRMVYLLAPPMYLLFGVHPLDASAAAIAAYALPHVFLSVVGGSTIAHTARHSFWAEVFETAIAPYIALITVLTAASPKHARFAVTAKGTQLDEASFDWRHAAPNLVIALLVLAAAIATPIRLMYEPLERGTLALAGFWNVYNLVILGAALAVALDRTQRRQLYRVRGDLRLEVRPRDDGGLAAGSAPNGAAAWHGRVVDFSEEGIRLRLTPDSPGGTVTGPLPTEVVVTLASHLAGPLVLDADVLETTAEDGALMVRARWAALSPAQLRRVIEEMFSGANTWIYHAAPPDRPFRSLAEVISAPWRTLSRRLGARSPSPRPAEPAPRRSAS
ncbi:MAG: UDP-forming cellulose synthase catalytic subunit [Pseudomonadota bacterium]|nr:UDP-forming cellulose synthase catalytic subunit [Pseudomonadota bacterium]